MREGGRFLFGLFILLGGSPALLSARVFMSQEQALQLAFPEGTTVERKNWYVTSEQKQAIEQTSSSKLDSSLVTAYIGVSSAGLIGCAFFHNHIVRTMPETLMVVVAPEGSINFVEILAFYEPDDYLPSKRWFGLFAGKKLDDQLWVKRGIRNVAGATLTTQAVTETVRRILAIYRIVMGPELERKK